MAKKHKNISKKLDTNTSKKVQTNSSLPKLSLFDRILKFADTTEGAAPRAQYEALFAISRPVDDALASNTNLLKEGAKVALAGLENSMLSKGADLKLQISRIKVCLFDDLDFSVLEARKVIGKYGKDGYDGIGAVRFCPVPHPETGATVIAMDAVTLYTGSPSPSRPIRRRRRASFGDEIERASSVTFNLSDRATVKAALASLFYPPLSRLPIRDPFENEGQRFAKGNSQTERALVTLMCRSQLPVKKMLIGFGAGKSVMDGAQSRIEYLLKEKCKGSPEVLHRDLVPHFWFGELRRLGLDHLSVPTIRLR